MIRYPIPPMIHGATQSSTWMSLFGGHTTVLEPEFNADEVWRTIHKHKVNLLFFTGDAMARPLLDALLAHQDAGNEYDLSSLFLLASTAALFSPSIKEKLLELLPNRVITDSIGSSETGFGGTSIVAKDAPHSGGPRVTIDHRTVVLDDDGNEVKPGSGVRGFIAKKGNIPVGYYKDEKKTAETFRTINGVRYAIPGDYAQVEEDGIGHHAGPRLGVDQQRRREDLPRGGRGRPQGSSRRLRRAGGRRARSSLRPACGRRCPGPAGGPAERLRSWTASCAPRSRDTKCRAVFGSSTRSSVRRPVSPTTAGPRSRPRRAPPTMCMPPTQLRDRLRQKPSGRARRVTSLGKPRGCDGLRVVDGGVPCAQVVSVDAASLTLRRLESVTPSPEAAHVFGRQLAATHDAGAAAFGAGPDGWDGPGFFGPLSQPLPMSLRRHRRWGDFYADERLAPMAELAAPRLDARPVPPSTPSRRAAAPATSTTTTARPGCTAICGAAT